MRKTLIIPAMMLGTLLGAGLAACAKEGPAERAGKRLDQAAQDLKEDAKQAADDVEDAAEKLQDKLDD